MWVSAPPTQGTVKGLPGLAVASFLLQEIVLRGSEGLDPQAGVSPHPTLLGSRVSFLLLPPALLACSSVLGPLDIPVSFQASKTHLQTSLIGDVADFSFVSTVRASKMAPSGPRLDAGLTPCRLQAGHLWRACLGNRSPSLSSLPCVRVSRRQEPPVFIPQRFQGPVEPQASWCGSGTVCLGSDFALLWPLSCPAGSWQDPGRAPGDGDEL